jgi:hypothetical protein
MEYGKLWDWLLRGRKLGIILLGMKIETIENEVFGEVIHDS